MTETEAKEEIAMCLFHPDYFIDNYCEIYDATDREWIPFDLWPEQKETLFTITDNRLVVILKARQLGQTWLVLAFALWLMLFHPEATILLFSRRDDEAIHLLDFRLKEMFKRLPWWIKGSIGFELDSKHEWRLSNGSVVYAFPTTAGDSYTATLAIVDEADLVPDLGDLMTAVKPTIDGGGRMILLSRSDKGHPSSPFKRIYKAAKRGLNDWSPVFLPWWVRPSRDQEWYEVQKQDTLANTGALDDLHEQYPATDTEALSPATLDKRIPSKWLQKCYDEMEPLETHDGPALPNFRVYKLPVATGSYVIGADPAEGNPTSDESSLHVLDSTTGEEVAGLGGRFQMDTFASYIDQVGQWYNGAAVLVERNNHGHTVLLWLGIYSPLPILLGEDGRVGWLSSARGKVMMYAQGASTFRNGTAIIHDFATFDQLASIEGGTLRAPDDAPDDRADSFVLAEVARTYVVTAGSQVETDHEEITISPY